MGVNSLPKTLTRQCRGCDLNPGPTAPESSTLTTRLPSHPTITNCVLNIPNLTHNPNQEADVGDGDLCGGGGNVQKRRVTSQRRRRRCYPCNYCGQMDDSDNANATAAAESN